jgi:hypothetical protein
VLEHSKKLETKLQTKDYFRADKPVAEVELKDVLTFGRGWSWRGPNRKHQQQGRQAE